MNRTERHPGDVVRVFLGLAIVGLTTVVAVVGPVGAIERNAFRLVNDLPDAFEPVLTAVQQWGAFYSVLITAAVALLARRPRLAMSLAVSGTTAYLAARLLKALVERGRPAAELADAILRGDPATGLGFPSGHSAVAAALATALTPYLPRWGRRAMWGVVFTVMVARIYLGAHLPIDVVGGAALGWAIGSLSNLAFSTPRWSPNPASLGPLFRHHGMTVASAEPLNVDACGSIPYVVSTEAGTKVFAKLVSNEERDSDALFKSWRLLSYKGIDDELPFLSARRLVEHEAFLALLAERAGVSTPKVLLAGPVAPDVAALAEECLDGPTLAAMEPDAITDDTLRTLWGEVVKLRAARIAHRDLRLGNVIVTADGCPWIVDFGFAESEASDRRLAHDVAELLAALASVVGVRRAVDGAVGGLGAEAVAAALPLLQPRALSKATRHAWEGRQASNCQGESLQELRREAAAAAGVDEPHLEQLSRVRARTVLLVVGLGIALYVLLPQLGDFKGALETIIHADPPWLVGAVLASVLTYAAAAVQLQGSVPERLNLAHTMEMGLASSFATRLTPASIGGVATDIRYLQRRGLEYSVAGSSYALSSATGVAVHGFLLVCSGVIVGTNGVGAAELPSGWILLVAVAVGLAVVGAALRFPRVRKNVFPPLREAAGGLRRVLMQPAKVACLFGGAIGVTGLYIAAFDLSLRAVGVHEPIAQVMFVYLGAAAIAAAAPTPGGLGAMEAALTAGLTAVGVAAAPALAGVLTFRLATYWLPILPGLLSFRHLRKIELL